MYPHRRLDGSNPDGVASSPDNGPGWMAEAVGTFVEVGPGTKQWGMHGFHTWTDDGSEAFGSFPCGGHGRLDPLTAEGSCH